MSVTIDNTNSSYIQSNSNLFKSSAGTNGQDNNSFKKLPFVFVLNEGQVNPKVDFYTSIDGLGVFLTKEEIMLTFIRRPSYEVLKNISTLDLTNIDLMQAANANLQGLAIALRPLGANPNVKIESMNQGSGRVNYLKGNDPEKWRTNLPTYGKIVYKELWEGIDLTLYEENGQLKYEFVVHPGARHENIRLSYDGMNDAYLDDNGNLVIDTSLGKVIDKHPESYQMINDRNVPVDSGFILVKQPDGKYVHCFKIGSGYDSNYPLVIDPGIYYSTFLGGSDRDSGSGIAIDARGSAYVTGSTSSSDFPTTVGTPFSGFSDAFVTKFSPDGSRLVYSTFLGGSDSASGNGIAVDASGSAYVTGSTSSPDFPTTPGAFDTLFNGASDAFITKLSPNGSKLVYSTFLGGSASDSGNGIAIDVSGSAYVTGLTFSSDFPTTPDAFDTSFNGGLYDAFVTKLSTDGKSLEYSTFLGGRDNDSGSGIAVGASGNAYVTGQTRSEDFPTTPGAFDTLFNGLFDAFVTELSPDGSLLEYSTFLGGEFGSDFGQAIAVDASGSAYVTGSTFSEDFPTTPGAFATMLNGISDAFVTKLFPDGSNLVYSTFLGGSNRDFGNGIAVDARGNAYITGGTDSSDFPTTPGAFEPLYNGSRDAFVTKLSPDGSLLVYSTFLGGSDIDFGNGIAVDASGNTYVTGQTFSEDFPTTPRAFDTSFNGDRDAFVTKLATTPQGQISILLAEIQALVSQGVLNRGQGISLTTPLNAALTQFNRGNCSLAVTQLNSFIARVAAFERAGVLTSAQSQELISEATRTINFINYLCFGTVPGGLVEALLKARMEQVQTLINNLGSSDYFTRVAATEELGRRIKEEPGSVIADYIKVTADMNNSEVRWRAEILLDIQSEKEQLACLNKQLGNINYSIQDLVVQKQRLQDSISQEQSRYNNKPGSPNTVI